MTELSPYSHPCDVGTIDYSMVKQGLIFCRCGKQWKFTPRGWIAYPLVKRRPA